MARASGLRATKLRFVRQSPSRVKFPQLRTAAQAEKQAPSTIAGRQRSDLLISGLLSLQEVSGGPDFTGFLPALVALLI
jgi:hypothetical protein